MHEWYQASHNKSWDTLNSQSCILCELLIEQSPPSPSTSSYTIFYPSPPGAGCPMVFWAAGRLGPEKPRGGFHVWGMRGRILEYGRICFNSLRFSGIRFGPEHGAEPILHSRISYDQGTEQNPFFTSILGSGQNPE